MQIKFQIAKPMRCVAVAVAEVVRVVVCYCSISTTHTISAMEKLFLWVPTTFLATPMVFGRASRSCPQFFSDKIRPRSESSIISWTTT